MKTLVVMLQGEAVQPTDLSQIRPLQQNGAKIFHTYYYLSHSKLPIFILIEHSQSFVSVKSCIHRLRFYRLKTLILQ